MFKIYHILILLFAFLVIASCKEESNPITGDNDLFVYPLEIGNKWEYNRHFATFNFRSVDSLDYPRYDDSVHYYSKIVIEIVRKETIQNNIETFVMRSVETGSAMQSLWSEHYYRNNNDGLYLYGYQLYAGGGNGLPKRSNSNRIIFNGVVFNSVSEITQSLDLVLPKVYSVYSDSINYENPPLKVISYPLNIDKEWRFRPPNQPFAISKRVIGKELVEYKAQQIQCYKVEWLYDINGDQEWDENISVTDFIADKGLIKRTIFVKDLIRTTAESPDANGYFDSAEEIILTNTNL